MYYRHFIYLHYQIKVLYIIKETVCCCLHLLSVCGILRKNLLTYCLINFHSLRGWYRCKQFCLVLNHNMWHYSVLVAIMSIVLIVYLWKKCLHKNCFDSRNMQHRQMISVLIIVIYFLYFLYLNKNNWINSTFRVELLWYCYSITHFEKEIY